MLHTARGFLEENPTGCSPPKLAWDDLREKALQCLNKGSPVDQKNNCLELDAKIPGKTFCASPDGQVAKGRTLSHEKLQRIFLWVGCGSLGLELAVGVLFHYNGAARVCRTGIYRSSAWLVLDGAYPDEKEAQGDVLLHWKKCGIKSMGAIYS
ncbi:hypothetical protein NC651_013008 [Populus alba x Populus x berolinensis]|nr:hypothetical protein NC651_013008 [Populus alba x Populus x berolinensis]